MKLEVKQVIITPEYAEELLKMNVNNRIVRSKKVAELAEAMKRGEWELTNDAIVISEGNILLNGQHRLMAVVKSGVPCPFILLTGAQDSAFDVMDTPVARRISDAIARKGGKNGVKMESAITRYINIHTDLLNGWETMKRFATTTSASRREVLNFYEKNEKLIDKWGEKDEKHICPLQLDTIKRAICLWSNEGDVVLTPFMGIGSEVYQSILCGRKGIGFELKESYFNEAVKNVKEAEFESNQDTLF